MIAQIEHVNPVTLKDVLLVLFSFTGLGLGLAGLYVRTRARRIEPQPLEVRPDPDDQRIERIESNIQTLSESLADHAERIGAIEALAAANERRFAELSRRLDDLPAQIVTMLRNTRARFDG